jgi:hypothetical protein
MSRRTIGRSANIEDIPRFWRMWHDESIAMLDIAKAFNVAIGTVRRTASRLGLPARMMTLRELDVAQGRDPTEEEIWGPGGLTEQIRSSWSDRREREAVENARCVVGDEVGRGRACGRQPLQAS